MTTALSHAQPPRDKSLGAGPSDSVVLGAAAIGLAGLGLLVLKSARPLLAFVPFGMASALSVRAFRLDEARSRWLRTGIRTSADVVEAARHWWPASDGYHGQFVVKYRYDAAGAARSGEDSPVGCWKSKPKPGDRIEILYDPSDPNVSAWFDDLPADRATTLSGR